jgi:hypothetical protein
VPIRFERTKDRVSKRELMNVGQCSSTVIFKTYQKTRQLLQGPKRYNTLATKNERKQWRKFMLVACVCSRLYTSRFKLNTTQR